ncbi:AraC family transcriptional regulator [Hoeflea sp.]|uniref:AraC family transcriptional regulator n=1 Tax=Hoeflea sp. TaxID=1940281 RepID=UPI003BAE7AB4
MTQDMPPRQPSEDSDTASQHAEKLAVLDGQPEPVVAFSHLYDHNDHVADHAHDRAQLLHPSCGVVAVTTDAGRWLVPPGHALWIPAGTRHAVDAIGRAETHSIYVRQDAGAMMSGHFPGQPPAQLPQHLHVAGMTPLMRSLMLEAVRLRGEPHAPRSAFILGAMLHEITQLPERPLGLPFPTHPKLARICRSFVASPSAHLEIKQWADAIGMSRRSFTRLFRRETGLSLSTWRQQACLLSALPRLSAGEPVTTIALELGYDSVPAFTTMFRRMLGTPPKTYLRNRPED